MRVLVGQAVPIVAGFPISTLTVNMIGTFLLCFIIAGAFRTLSAHKDVQDIVTTGFLGSFTTFSALSVETLLLVENNQFILAGLYVLCSIIGGLSVGALGFRLGGKQVRT